jgi:hypothetical protein
MDKPRVGITDTPAGYFDTSDGYFSNPVGVSATAYDLWICGQFSCRAISTLCKFPQWDDADRVQCAGRTLGAGSGILQQLRSGTSRRAEREIVCCHRQCIADWDA